MRVCLILIKLIPSVLGLCFIESSFSENLSNDEVSSALTSTDEYIVVFKDREFDKEDRLRSNGKSVKEIVDEMIDAVRLNQRDKDILKGISRSPIAESRINGYRHVYTKAIKGFSATLTPESVNYLRDNPLVDFIEKDLPIHGEVIQSPTPDGALGIPTLSP